MRCRIIRHQPEQRDTALKDMSQLMRDDDSRLSLLTAGCCQPTEISIFFSKEEMTFRQLNTAKYSLVPSNDHLCSLAGHKPP